MIGIGIVGYGYWGPNLVRNFSRLTNARITWVCDIDQKLLADVPRLYPTIQTTAVFDDLLKDPDTHAVVIATPVSTHFPLGHLALKAGKHLFIEKPMTMTVKDARFLTKLARKKRRILMVDHTFVHTPAVEKIKEILRSKTLGTLQYIDCVRTNLGLLQKDTNVIYDLAPHDFGVLHYLLGRNPTSISATGASPHNTGQEEVAHISAQYGKNLFVHSHVSWLSPIKIRTMIFVGTEKMLLYDDMESSEKIKIYDKSVSVTKNPKLLRQLRIGYRTGEMVSPHIPVAEGLAGATLAFVKAIETKKAPASDGRAGTDVVGVIEAATKSLRQKGKSIRV